jgi:hypothetical protein
LAFFNALQSSFSKSLSPQEVPVEFDLRQAFQFGDLITSIQRKTGVLLTTQSDVW